MPTPNLALPFIMQGQAQKEVTHNEALRMLDALVQLAVLDRDPAAPPGAPAEGERWIVKAPGTGAWSGHDNQIAAWQDGAWRFSAPRVGWLAYVVDEQALLAWTGGAWTNALNAFQRLLLLGVNTDADATNRLAVKSDGALFSHDDVTPGTGDLRVALNKSAAARDVGFTFQDAFSTRALFGLLGDDDFTVKVSPDGVNYFVGFVVDRTSGRLKLPLAPKFSAYTNFDNYVAANAWTKVQFNNADSNDQNAFNGGTNSFVAPFAGNYVLGFSLRFKANAAVPTKAVVAFFKNGVELGRGRAVSGAPVGDVTTFNLSVLTPLAAADAVDVRVQFTTNDGYIEADQSHFWGHYVP